MSSIEWSPAQNVNTLTDLEARMVITRWRHIEKLFN